MYVLWTLFYVSLFIIMELDAKRSVAITRGDRFIITTRHIDMLHPGCALSIVEATAVATLASISQNAHKL